MPYQPATAGAFKLFHQGTLALSRMEAVGMPINLPKMQANREEVALKIREGEAKLRKHEVYKTQQKIFGKETSLGSRDQLAYVLFQHMKLKGAKKTKNGKYKLDDDTLRLLDMEYCDSYLSLQKLVKLKGTYLDALCNLAVNGRIHGSLNLHKVKSFRGSAEEPNLNNLPSRNKIVTAYVKGAVCPSPGYLIVESDYGALEVRVAATYHKDATMLSYLETGYDMHREIAKQCFIYDDDFIAANPSLTKDLRTEAKGAATFAFCYGSTHPEVAQRLWKIANKKNMLAHLASKGVKRLGMEYDEAEARWIVTHGPDAFVTHIKNVEYDFWNVRFPSYGQWRLDWYRAYMQKGFCMNHTGFMWYGVERKTFINNFPIQSSAFLLLLQAIILIQQELIKRKMKSRLFLEIHDSILAEVYEPELEEYIALTTDIMTNKMRQMYDWLCLDLVVEHEYSPISWADKKPYEGKY
jgi:DNA polymerase-1